MLGIKNLKKIMNYLKQKREDYHALKFLSFSPGIEDEKGAGLLWDESELIINSIGLEYSPDLQDDIYMLIKYSITVI